jgi:hypothetical protein
MNTKMRFDLISWNLGSNRSSREHYQQQSFVRNNVFDLQKEFHDNRNESFFGHFWARLPFEPKIFAKKCSLKLKNWLLPYFCMRNPKKWSRDDLLLPRFQLRWFSAEIDS